MSIVIKPGFGTHRQQNYSFNSGPTAGTQVVYPVVMAANSLGPKWRASLNYDQPGNPAPPAPGFYVDRTAWPTIAVPQARHRMYQQGFAGPQGFGAPSEDKIRRKVSKFREKVEQGKRCGVWPFGTRAACERKLAKWEEKLAAVQNARAATQNVLELTSPEAQAAAISQAAAANVAAVQGGQNTLAYVAAGGVVLSAVVFAGIMLLRSGGRRR